MSERIIVLDTETTGLKVADGNRIIEIACVEIIDRHITNNIFHTYVNPKCEIEEGALAVHGITNSFLEDKPLFADIVHQWLEYVGHDELVIHNAPFDLEFLNHELNLINQTFKLEDRCKITDTYLIACKKHPTSKKSLDALCRNYQINNEHRQLHGALLDAELLAQVYLAMTGGQINMQLTQSKSSQTNNQHQSIPIEQAEQAGAILYADQEELDLHQKKIDEMNTTGSCLWTELDKLN